jgi:hypothetical protein
MGHFLCNVRSFRLISGGVSLGVYSRHSTSILDVSTLRAVFTDDESKSKCHPYVGALVDDWAAIGCPGYPGLAEKYAAQEGGPGSSRRSDRGVVNLDCSPTPSSTPVIIVPRPEQLPNWITECAAPTSSGLTAAEIRGGQ